MSVRDVDALAAYLAAAEGTPFAWGAHDCVRFATGAVEAATGSRLALPVDWSTRVGALRGLTRMGGLEAAVDAVLTRTPVGLAQRGDVALVEDRVLGVVEGEAVLVLHPERGFVRLPRASIRIAWSAT